jgi:hypothetical protein
VTIRIEIVHGESAKFPGRTVVQAQLQNYSTALQDDATYAVALRQLSYVAHRHGGATPPQTWMLVPDPQWPSDVRQAAEDCREMWKQWARENAAHISQPVEFLRNLRPANSKIGA